MMTRDLNPDNTHAGQSPALSPVMRRYGHRVAVNPSRPGVRMARGVLDQASTRFQSFQRVVLKLRTRCFDGAVYQRSRKPHSPNTLSIPAISWKQAGPLANTQIAPFFRRTLCRSLDLTSEDHASLRLIADPPSPGNKKNHNHPRRLMRALLSPIGRQKRMNHYEKNHVNQCVAIRREPDCNRRR